MAPVPRPLSNTNQTYSSVAAQAAQPRDAPRLCRRARRQPQPLSDTAQQRAPFAHYQHPPQHAQNDRIDRRSLVLHAPCTALLAAAPFSTAWLPPPASAAAIPQKPPACTAMVSRQLAVAFTRAPGTALQEMQILPDEQYQREFRDFEQREFRYYQESNKDRFPVDASVSNDAGFEPLFLNFTTYAAWKVAARHVVGADQRTRFCQVAGDALLREVWPQGVNEARDLAKQGGGKASEAGVVSLAQSLLDILERSGYCCKSQIVWGELPGGWPQDWMVSEPSLAGFDPAQNKPAPTGLNFQVKIHRPADLEGSIALRSEEEGFWSRAVSSMLTSVLAAAGYSSSQVDEYFYQDQWQGPKTFAEKALLAFGDPLLVVGVDFVPTTLVQDWELR